MRTATYYFGFRIIKHLVTGEEVLISARHFDTKDVSTRNDEIYQYVLVITTECMYICSFFSCFC